MLNRDQFALLVENFLGERCEDKLLYSFISYIRSYYLEADQDKLYRLTKVRPIAGQNAHIDYGNSHELAKSEFWSPDACWTTKMTRKIKQAESTCWAPKISWVKYFIVIVEGRKLMRKIRQAETTCWAPKSSRVKYFIVVLVGSCFYTSFLLLRSCKLSVAILRCSWFFYNSDSKRSIGEVLFLNQFYWSDFWSGKWNAWKNLEWFWGWTKVKSGAKREWFLFISLFLREREIDVWKLFFSASEMFTCGF